MRIAVYNGDITLEMEDDKQEINIGYSDQNSQLVKLIETMANASMKMRKDAPVPPTPVEKR